MTETKLDTIMADLGNRLVAAYAAAGAALMFWALCEGLSGGFATHEHTPWTASEITLAVTWTASVIWTGLRTAWRPQ